MRRFYLLSLLFMIVLSGCETSIKPTPTPSFNLSYMHSKEEGKYYLVALGTNEEQDLELQQVFDQNKERISGYYQNGTPNDVELRTLNIHEFPVYIIFDTEKEIFRTDNLVELNQYLHDKAK
ncbi:hypothetical protein M3194_00100 [Paenibacillus glycanilyticus]|uniref:hypothetical protein n=1 Tax=Paenibacillus glycanilyticus TaxID=126569 RepID=UPI00203DE78E|nr:hypothetical protein [Paenibacillus glycanilyticus]MCM3625760.1 hypothetical protein [Paenibacillus glycanilyticus]